MVSLESMEHWNLPLGVFDLETTGIDTRDARIVTACVAILDATGAVLERADWVADPGIDIPPQATAVHGYSTERARAEGRPAAEVVGEIAHRMRALFDAGTPVVVYNAPYDLSLLAAECRRYGLPPIEHPFPVVDPLVMDRAVDRFRKGSNTRTLVYTAELYGIALDEAHDAGSDAIAAGRVAQALIARYPDQLDVSPADLHGRQEAWHRSWAEEFQSYLRRNGKPDAVIGGDWPTRS